MKLNRNIQMNTLFDPIVFEFESSKYEAEYNTWFKAKIEKAMLDTRPTIPHDKVVDYLKKRRVGRDANNH